MRSLSLALLSFTLLGFVALTPTITLGQTTNPSSEMISKISISELWKMMAQEGYTTSIVRERNERIVHWKTAGMDLVVQVSHDGTVILFRSVPDDSKGTMEDMNEWNIRSTNSRAYIDQDHNPVFEMSLLIDGGVTTTTIKNFLKSAEISAEEWNDFVFRRHIGPPKIHHVS